MSEVVQIPLRILKTARTTNAVALAIGLTIFGALWLKDLNGIWEALSGFFSGVCSVLALIIEYLIVNHDDNRQPALRPVDAPQSLGQKTLDRIHDEMVSKLLSDALIWAKQINDADLEKWCYNELNGYYGTVGDTPTYRNVPGRWIDRFGNVLEMDDPKVAEFIYFFPLGHGAKLLEDFASDNRKHDIDDVYLAAAIAKASNFPAARFRIFGAHVRSILDSIRLELTNRLADAIQQAGSKPLPPGGE